MTGKLIRNVLFALIIALWVWVSVDMNRVLLEVVPRHESSGQIVYYLVIPGIVIAASFIALLRRWRREYSFRDGVMIGCPILFVPLYLLPMQ